MLNRLLCAIFGHHNVHTLGLVSFLPDELVCLRCYQRAPYIKEPCS